jgi:hypothetical protein
MEETMIMGNTGRQGWQDLQVIEDCHSRVRKCIIQV